MIFNSNLLILFLFFLIIYLASNDGVLENFKKTKKLTKKDLIRKSQETAKSQQFQQLQLIRQSNEAQLIRQSLQYQSQSPQYQSQLSQSQLIQSQFK
jgi:hypothetical protein